MSGVSFPVNYPATMSLSVPSTLQGDQPKVFPAAKAQVKSIPCSTASVGPSTTCLFQLPTGQLGFIKSGSMYLRGKISVTQTGAASTSWAFAGQTSNSANYDFGSASMLLSRVNINLGSLNVSYPNYNHFKQAVIPHCANANWLLTDDRILESLGVTKTNTDTTQGSRDLYFAIPLFLPIFNADQHFPALLMNSPIVIEILTESINNAFYCVTNAVTNYSLSEMSIVYEEIQVSPEFKSALVSSKQGEAYSLSINDMWSIGPTATTQSQTYQIGCGLSSLKAVLFTEQLQSAVANATTGKKYLSNGLSNFNVYVNNEMVNPPNLDNQQVVFAEMNRALQRINDSQYNSYVEPDTTTATGSNDTTYYPASNFLAGVNTMSVSDWGFSMTGRNASNVTLELVHSAAIDAVKWGNASNYAAANLYIFLLYDSILSVDVATGVVSMRK